MTKNIVHAAILTMFAASVYASVPRLMNYQGKLTDEYGVPVPDGSYTIRFRIYTDSVAGDVLWEELQWSVPVNSGLFNVLLGGEVTIPDSVFSGDVRWLGMQVSPDPELTPRKPIVSMAYAFRSLRADTAEYAYRAPRDDDWLPDTSGLHIYRPTGNVGIGMVSLDSRLGVAGTAEMTGFKMATGASDGYVLTSDASGQGNWKVAIPDNDWVISGSDIYREQGKVGIGTANPRTTLHAAGTVMASAIDLGGEPVIRDGNTVYEVPLGKFLALTSIGSDPGWQSVLSISSGMNVIELWSGQIRESRFVAYADAGWILTTNPYTNWAGYLFDQVDAPGLPIIGGENTTYTVPAGNSLVITAGCGVGHDQEGTITIDDGAHAATWTLSGLYFMELFITANAGWTVQTDSYGEWIGYLRE